MLGRILVQHKQYSLSFNCYYLCSPQPPPSSWGSFLLPFRSHSPPPISVTLGKIIQAIVNLSFLICTLSLVMTCLLHAVNRGTDVFLTRMDFYKL